MFWRWTDSQIIYESLITVMFLVAAIVAYGLLRKGGRRICPMEDLAYWRGDLDRHDRDSGAV